MPRTRFHKRPTEDERFDDFEAPATTDGSYVGRKKHTDALQAHLDKKFNDEFSQVQKRLKQANVKVGILREKDTIALRATLPLKPGDKGNGFPTKQYKLFLSIPANLDGLKTAEEESYELGKLIARKQFEWNEKYLGKKRIEENRIKTMGELLEDFEENYFKKHKRTIKSENTFNSYLRNMRIFDPNTPATQEDMTEAIKNMTSSDAYKNRSRATMNVLFSVSGLSIKVERQTKSNPLPRKRSIPTDSEIVAGFRKFERHASSRKNIPSTKDNWVFWRWVYGMLATYGLRPRELFLNPHIDWWLSPENVDNTWEVDEGGKTGHRKALPLMPEWVELFDLKNPSIAHTLKAYAEDKQNTRGLATATAVCSKWFEKRRGIGIGFRPYDLRHAWAIRAHLLGVPVKAAADNLGHSVEIHTKTYQRWFSEENRRKAINEALAKKSELELLKEEIISLKLEIEKLKIENQRLTLDSQKAVKGL